MFSKNETGSIHIIALPAHTILKRYALPVTDFLKHNAELNAESLASMSFVFDQGEQGALWLNDVGFHLQ